MIILISTNIFLFDVEDHLPHLFELVNGFFLKFANPDLCDSLLKLCCLYAKKILKHMKEITLKKVLKPMNENTQAKSNHINYLSSLCKTYSLLLEWPLNTELKLKETYLNNFYQNSYLLSSTLLKENQTTLKAIFQNQPLVLPRIMFSWINLQRKHYKPKTSELMSLYCEFFLNINDFLSSNAIKMEFFYMGETTKNKKVFILPYCIDFIIDQYDILVFPNPLMVRKIFEGLMELLKCITANAEELFKGDDANYPDYDELLNKLIKLAIDSQDSECKEYLIKCLRILSKKTPLNMKIQMQAADYNKQHSRVDLISKIINIQ